MKNNGKSWCSWLVGQRYRQAVYGPKADILKSDIKDLLDSGAEIPVIDFAGQHHPSAKRETTLKVKAKRLSLGKWYFDCLTKWKTMYSPKR